MMIASHSRPKNKGRGDRWGREQNRERLKERGRGKERGGKEENIVGGLEKRITFYAGFANDEYPVFCSMHDCYAICFRMLQ
jgi:hypothetical protein